jgi:general stress protein 26
MVQASAVDDLNQRIQGIPIAILTTVRPDTSLHSCPMAAQPVDADGSFWFLTPVNTEKVEAVRTIQRVNLSFSDAHANRYVSVSGFCELIRDVARAKQLWISEYKEWFPAGPEDPNLVLMRIVVQQAEYWSTSQSRMISITGFPGKLQ